MPRRRAARRAVRQRALYDFATRCFQEGHKARVVTAEAARRLPSPTARPTLMTSLKAILFLVWGLAPCEQSAPRVLRDR